MSYDSIAVHGRTLGVSRRKEFISALFGGRVSRIPVGNAVSVATVGQMEATGCRFPDAHTDADKMAGLAASSFDWLGYATIMPVFSVVQEAAALGCEINWRTLDEMPTVEGAPYSLAEDFEIPADFLDHPSCRVVLTAIRRLKREYGRHAVIVGKAMGPWTLSYHLVGVEDFLIATIEDPARVRALLNKLKEATLRFALAQLEAGADVLTLADHATGDLVSPKGYRDYLLPIHQELTAQIPAPTILHICGNTYDRLDDISRSGFDCFHFESKVDAKRAVERVAGRTSLMGNINNPGTLLFGTPDEVYAESMRVIEAGVNILAPECAVPLRTSDENLKALSLAARRH